MDIFSLLGGGWSFVIGTLLPFLFVLTIVVFFHELGHFMVGRWCGVDVEVFSVGFGPELAGFNDKHGTRWKLSAIPLGGYVKFFGDADAASSPDFDKLSSLNETEKSRTFEGKSVWSRIAVVAAGPLANFLLAFVIFTGSSWYTGEYVTDPVVVEVVEGGAADRAGIKPGDFILSIDGEETASFVDVKRLVAPAPNRELTFVVRREGKEVTLKVVPELLAQETGFGKTQDMGTIGVVSNAKAGNGHWVSYSFSESCVKAVEQIRYLIVQTFRFIYDLFAGRQSAEQLSGPLRIADMSGDVATLGIVSLIGFAGILSVSIGLINLFPIPMLDGGHLLFYLYEIIRGKPPGERVLEMAYRVGFLMVISLMVFATWNDVSYFLRQWFSS